MCAPCLLRGGGRPGGRIAAAGAVALASVFMCIGIFGLATVPLPLLRK